ncbi:MAG: sigma-54 dependent transcriptional regulator [Candidatus Hinthialibacter antarcticus]|nr:sigma-54 dependent transcriptional regulator [Candidatus Hinthialibacter antarcticus]
MKARILVVEDDSRYSARIQKNLNLEGYETVSASCGEEALQALSEQQFDLVMSDIKMPGMDGVSLLKQISARKDLGHEMPVIMLTSVDSVRVAVDAMREGASDYITKDADREEILLRIENVLDRAKMQEVNNSLRRHLHAAHDAGSLVAESDGMKAIRDEIHAVADAGACILIVGETGVGKEIVARYIHRCSPRAEAPFIDVNCAALPNDNLFQSEVFGHEKGAFTGASVRKRGKLELADTGTIFLDEIGDMPLESQGKILRAIETKEFERLGGSQKINVDIAIIAATNKDLNAEVQNGFFRQDLLFRLDVIRITIPPLRERQADILPLATRFLDEYARKYNRPSPSVSKEAIVLLEAYSWPGNVRELKNLIERIVIRNRDCKEIDKALVSREGLSADGAQTLRSNQDFPSLEEVEKKTILQALEQSNWVQSEAAKLLKISADRINSRIKKYNIQHSSWRSHKPV